MRTLRLAALGLLLTSSLSAAACGGGGDPFSLPSQDITVTSTALPLTLSGDTIDHVLPLTGGCGGPYVMSVIGGALPPGMRLDNATRSIQGIALQAGNFAFTIQIDDTGCTPFASTTASFSMNIGVGAVRIVACDPAIIPVADYNPPFTVKYTDCDGLDTTVFNQFAVFNFTVAGGTPPYVMDFIDDPADPNDNTGLPLGVAIPPFSTSLVGSPLQVLPGGKPYRITLRATDALSQTGTRKVQWKIDTPPIIIATTTLPNGKCGTTYSQSIQIVDGVPPFTFEQTTTAPAPLDDIVYNSPNAPVVDGGLITVSQVTGLAANKATALNYPSAAATGPFSGITPEGVYLREATGSFSGIPRRTGAFTFHVHVCSTLVPNEFGQHAWMSYNVSFANSEPPTAPAPAFGFNGTTWTTEGTVALLGAAPWSTIPEMEVGLPYNPDGGVAGLSFKAQGGVPKDGFTDGPHFSQITNIDGTGAPPTFELAGGYNWTINWDADGVGAPNPPTGVSFTTWTGILAVTTPASLVGRGRTTISFTCTDQQLPTSATHTITGRAAYSIGPDKVIITESTESSTATQSGTDWNTDLMTVKKLLPFSAGATISTLSNATDMTAGTSIPTTTSITTLSSLLDQIDLLRVTVNPSTFRDDVHGLNANGARPMQHGDFNDDYTYSNPSWNSGASPDPANPTATCVELATAPSVAHSPGTGVYNNGGQLYAFQGSGKFGVFIIRRDSSITIPIAFSTSISPFFTGFGDGMVDSYGANKQSILQTAQMTVSPDGRFAAMKLKTNSSTNTGAFSESAASTKIVLFSLTGEKPFGGQMFRVINTGSSGGSTTGGIYQYANSLVLTNRYLYYLCGNYTSTYSSWKEHLIYRYEITAGAASGALLAPNALAGWVNNTGSIANMMQTPFQKHDNVIQSSSSATFNPTTFFIVNGPAQDMYADHGWNATENAVAPIPFRVSADGKACAILAGQEANSFSSASVMNHDVWVDYDGTLRKLSTVPRHAPHGGGRGYSLARGPNAYNHWARYTGPTTAFEISADATKVAVVVNRQTGTISGTSNTNWYSFREDVIAYRTTNSWASATEIQVTGTESATAPVFAGSHLWRFGSLVFTKDNAGLIFWGGRNSQNSSVSTAYEVSRTFSGTYYSYDFGTGTIKSILAAADGGSDVGLFTHDNASNPVNPAGPTTTTVSEAHGRIRPFGGFVSRTGDFFYVVTLYAISGSEQRGCGLIGFNIRSLNNAASINGKVDGRGFLVAGQHARRGFTSLFYYTPYYGLEYTYYSPASNQGWGRQVMSRDKGTVYFASHYQANGPTLVNTATSSFYGGVANALYWGDYGAYAGQVEGFQPDVGGAIQRITLASLGTVDGTTGRSIHWVEPSKDGGALSFVYDPAVGQRYMNQETAVYIQKIAFNPTTGALSGTPVQFQLSGGGRVSGTMAHDSTGTRLYYAYGSSNENSKQIAEITFNGATNTIGTRLIGTPRWYEVLHSGR